MTLNLFLRLFLRLLVCQTRVMGAGFCLSISVCMRVWAKFMYVCRRNTIIGVCACVCTQYAHSVHVWIGMCECRFMHACMCGFVRCVFLCAGRYIGMHEEQYVCMYVCMYAHTYSICMYVCMYVCMYIRMST